MKKHIPNFITLLNLLSGVIAIILATQNQLEYAAYFVFAGIIFDFFDGFIARILHVKSELGVQLDSLADMVTSGVAPGIVMFQLLRNASSDWHMTDYFTDFKEMNFLPFLGLLITLSAAYRLAKFNIDDRQDHDFIGLPTPALTLFVVSLPLISIYGNHEWTMNMVQDSYFLIATTLLGSFLMNSELSMFSLKLSSISIKDNWIQYILLAFSLLFMIWLHIASIPFIIIFYIVLCIIDSFMGNSQKTITV
ncbi:MAG TPA: phosphatidylserine synthase [Lutibacter sp.]|nr:phosphatidylserine synthase [Lutibacter sp.]